MANLDIIAEKMKQMRINTGGYECPRCGNVWVDHSNTIRATQIKGIFGSHPAWCCSKCGYTWKWK